MSDSALRHTTLLPVALALAVGGLITFAVYDANRAATAAGVISGSARVVDGDTLEIAGKRVRLEGIDAPEAGQTCPKNGGAGHWRCGLAAGEALEELISGTTVECRAHGSDSYGRTLGTCFARGRDVNAEMVVNGHAWAFVRYSNTYVAEEAHAREAKRGIWQSESKPAWVYREQKWAASEEAAPSGCAIKGNITNHGHIYHMPWSPWYAKVRIDASKGERWFCSETEAAEAGWRPVDRF